MDTVPPFIAHSEDELTIFGRGACDAKGSIVTQLIAINEMLNDGSLNPNDIGLVFYFIYIISFVQIIIISKNKIKTKAFVCRSRRNNKCWYAQS